MRQPGICKRIRHGKTFYYCELDGKQQGLGSDLAKAKEVFAEKLKASGQKEILIAKPDRESLTVISVFAEFLQYIKKHRAPGTFKFYDHGIERFISYLRSKKKLELLVKDFGPMIVEDWLLEKSAKPNYAHTLIRAVSAPFTWALKKRPDLREQIATHPLTGIDRPMTTARDAYVTPEQWQKVVENVSGEFADVIHFLYETGARPIEARLAEAKHFNRDERLLYFDDPPKKMNGRREPRTIYLTAIAFEIVQRLAMKYPSGPLFRNQNGMPWKKDAIICRCRELKDKLGFKLQAYALRHTFCTNRLQAGVDPLTVAALMGHKDGTMVMKVYQKMNKLTDHLRAALTKKTG